MISLQDRFLCLGSDNFIIVVTLPLNIPSYAILKHINTAKIQVQQNESYPSCIFEVELYLFDLRLKLLIDTKSIISVFCYTDNKLISIFHIH